MRPAGWLVALSLLMPLAGCIGADVDAPPSEDPLNTTSPSSDATPPAPTFQETAAQDEEPTTRRVEETRHQQILVGVYACDGCTPEDEAVVWDDAAEFALSDAVRLELVATWEAAAPVWDTLRLRLEDASGNVLFEVEGTSPLTLTIDDPGLHAPRKTVTAYAEPVRPGAFASQGLTYTMTYEQTVITH